MVEEEACGCPVYFSLSNGIDTDTIKPLYFKMDGSKTPSFIATAD